MTAPDWSYVSPGGRSAAKVQERAAVCLCSMFLLSLPSSPALYSGWQLAQGSDTTRHSADGASDGAMGLRAAGVVTGSR